MMAISYISGSTENFNGGTITNSGKTTNNHKNFSSARTNADSIGSVVVQNNNVTKVDSDGEFAYNNSAPISMLYTTSLAGLDKQINGNYPIANNAKAIKSFLTATAIREGQFNIATGKFTTPPDNDIYYLCPDNSLGGCFQEPQEVLPDIPFGYDAQTGQPAQRGIMLRFRAVDSLIETWNTIYVPQSLLTYNSTTTSNEDGSTSSIDMYTIDSNNFADILPNGEYNIQYDTAIQNAFVSLSSHEPTNSVVRINSKANITDSRIAAIFKLESKEAPKLLPYSGNPNQPNYAINSQNTAIFNSLIDKILNNSYIIRTNSISGLGVGEIEVPYTIRLTNPTTMQQYYDYYTLRVGIQTQNLEITYQSLSITSRNNVNGSNVVIAKEMNLLLNPSSDIISGWLAPSLYAAHNAGSY